MRVAEPYFSHDRSGRVLSLSSVSASTGFSEQSIYGGTKAALEGIDSQELVEDAKTSGGRPAYVGEIAGIIAMLVGEDAA